MALSNADEVIQAAEQLMESADRLHAWILAAIDAKKINQANAQTLFANEINLRQRCDMIYLEAAKTVVKGLALPQKELIGVVKSANAKIETIQKIAKIIDLVADLIVLATSIYAAKPGPIIAAIGEVVSDVKDL